MTEVVGNEGDCHQTIVVSKLKCLQLCNLKSLTSFSPRYYSFEFPCLEELVVEHCPKLKIFSEGVLSTPQLQRIKQSSYREKWSWTSDLNTTIKQLYTEKDGLYNPYDFNISDTFPESIEIWTRNPQEILGFKNLSSLQFYKCSSLKYIFTPSILLSLNLLQRIEVQECSSMEQVVREEEEAMTHKFTFLSLLSVTIESCSSLTNFHLGSQALEFPQLRNIRIAECPKMTAFSSSVSRESGDASENVVGKGGIYDNTATFFSNKDCVRCSNLRLCKVPRLKNFYSRMRTTQWPSLKQMDIIECPKLQIFTRQCPVSQVGISNQQPLFCVNETSATLPYSFIRSLPKLQKLVINNASISEIVWSEGLSKEERHTSVFYQLKDLRLSQLPELTLKTFKPSLLSFKNLTTLEVSRCHGFINLIACSTAKCLTLLERLSIDDCEMIEEIIACEAEEIQGGMVFPKLKYLQLSCLPCLASFSLAHHSLEFPVLLMVMVTKFPQMRNFCQDLSTPRLEQMHLTRDEEGELQWEGDLNTTIKHMLDEMNGQNSEVTEVTDQLPKLE
ncbi:hypothetical protein GOBAR_DD11947 [Gossypium barbadense]|nr:hypothetical protein GOBAR_DD11947 [Gossypium barbadense]